MSRPPLGTGFSMCVFSHMKIAVRCPERVDDLAAAHNLEWVSESISLACSIAL